MATDRPNKSDTPSSAPAAVPPGSSVDKVPATAILPNANQAGLVQPHDPGAPAAQGSISKQGAAVPVGLPSSASAATTSRYGDADPTAPAAPAAPSAPSSPTAPSSPATPDPTPALPPATQAPSPQLTQAQIDDLTAQVAATTTIEDSTVTLLQGIASQFAAAAPGNAAVAALSAKLHASAARLGQAITDCTPFAAPPVTPAQAQMGAVRSKR